MGGFVSIHMIQASLLLICSMLMVTPCRPCASPVCYQRTVFGPSPEEGCDKPEMYSSKPSSAIMLYEPLPFLEPFHKDRRSFTLSGQRVQIHQKWSELGVAAVVWDAAIVLSEYLETEVLSGRMVLADKKIIELGAGTGLVTIAVALLGGIIISTDRKEALSLLRENIEANFKEGLSPWQEAVKTEELSWGEDLDAFPEKFDLILGADIIYVEETFEKLLETIKHLSCKSTRVLLSCRIRYDRDLRFLDMLREYYDVTRVHRSEERGIDIYQAIMKR